LERSQGIGSGVVIPTPTLNAFFPCLRANDIRGLTIMVSSPGPTGFVLAAAPTGAGCVTATGCTTDAAAGCTVTGCTTDAAAGCTATGCTTDAAAGCTETGCTTDAAAFKLAIFDNHVITLLILGFRDGCFALAGIGAPGTLGCSGGSATGWFAAAAAARFRLASSDFLFN